MSGHLCLARGRRHLKEELLEIACGTGEGRDPDPRSDGRREQFGGRFVVAAEAELDLSVVEDRRGCHSRIRREMVTRDLQAVADQDANAQDSPETEAALDVADLAGGDDLAVVDDRDVGAQLLQLGKNRAADDDRLADRPGPTDELA